MYIQLLKALDIAQYGILKLLKVSSKSMSRSSFRGKALLIRCCTVKNHVRRIRGGFLRCQGLWISHELSIMIAQRLVHSVADQLIPFFGKEFPSTCYAPGQFS